MADKLEETLAHGIEDDASIKAMAARLAPRGNYSTPTMVSSGSIEAKLAEIERLIREIRATSAQVKGLLG